MMSFVAVAFRPKLLLLPVCRQTGWKELLQR